MATIITVHGTNAGDESDSGDQWWQQGSAFQNKLSEYVEAPDGRLEFKPFHWGVGPNSELKRRDAGNDLRRTMLDLEKEQEHYSVIGHSHGGSVLNHALFSTYAKKLSLQNMKSWVTVGTPFIQTSRKSFYFSRFNQFAQFAFFTLAIYLAIAIPLLFNRSEDGAIVWLLIPASLSALLFYVTYIFSQRSRKRHSDFHQVEFFNSNFHSWFGLIHRNDEAIQGLKNANSLKITTFSAKSIAEPISIVSVYLCMAYFSAMLFKNDVISGYINVPGFTWIFDILSDFFFFRLTFAPVEYTTGVAFLIWLSVSFTITWISTRYLLLPLFYVLSRLGNAAINRSIRASAFGNDAYGEAISGASSVPDTKKWSANELPTNLAQEIEEYTEQYAIDAIRKIRALIGSNIASSDNPITDQISDTLSWKELIHTAYFDVDNFIKLVAVSLCEAGLVTPSEKLKSDPEYDKVVGWYHEMKPRKPA